ncbi:MAG: NAD(P)H-hydrate dehydratase [Chlamydiales bacterium]
MIPSLKVLTAQEMSRIEKRAYEDGASEEAFMENAGKGIAEQVENFIDAHLLEKKVTLLVGKGNNGGDALAAGRHLLAKGFSVRSIHTHAFEECSSLSQKQQTAFKAAGGDISSQGKLQGLLLDGLTGTGFHGKAEGPLASLIELANQSKLPILAVDIPSGLNGTSGEVGSIAIRATQTLYLELPKLGFFLKEGWNHVGELVQVPFGLDEKYRDEAEAVALLLDSTKMGELLPTIRRNRHKYQAGYLVAVAGSKGFSGAAFLSCLAALRSGAGIVRLFHAWDMECEMGGAPLELVKEELGENGMARILEECERASALLIGPGIGRSKESKQLLNEVLPRLSLPNVIDADALFLLSKNSHWKLPSQTILTPHRKEAERVLGISSEEDEQLFLQKCQEYVNTKQVTLILKGGPTFIFHPNTTPFISTRGDPGMATAGTGDVLTGILGALLAQKFDPLSAAVLGVTLHGIAGEIAAFQKTSYSLIASDLIEHLSDAFLELINTNTLH